MAINTGGGLVNEGDIEAGRDVVGRDQYNQHGRHSDTNANVNVNVSRDEQGRYTSNRDNSSRVERALWGDTYTGYPGLIKEVHDLKQAFDDFVRADVNSQRTWVTPNVAILFLALAIAILLLGFYGITVYGK